MIRITPSALNQEERGVWLMAWATSYATAPKVNDIVQMTPSMAAHRANLAVSELRFYLRDTKP